MPILWRFLCGHYLKVFFLCVVTFVAILLTTRLEEIAHFATLGPEGLYILLFTYHQIPYILPIALPIAALISSILLFQKLSKTHELTALRSSGMGLKIILAPLLISALFLSGLNFYVVSEMSTTSHLSTNKLKSKLKAVNPLLLAHNKHLLKMKGIYFDTLGSSRIGEYASDVIFAIPNRKNNGINLMVAKNLQANPQEFSGKKITVLATVNDHKEEGFDQLLIQNIGEGITTIEDFSQIIEKKTWAIHNDHLQLPLLLSKLQDEKASLNLAKEKGQPISTIKQVQRSINRVYSELIRRFSVALAVFSFTLMGTAFGMSISRNHSSKRTLGVAFFTALFMIAYFAAKGIDHLLISSTLIYVTPHLLIIGSSLWMIRRVTRGIE